MRQLAGACEVLSTVGFDASAVVVASDENLNTARSVGFTAVRHRNSPLGEKWNRGYEVAARQGADLFVPIGSDDWVDPKVFMTALPERNEVLCFRLSAMVRPDGGEIAHLEIPYRCGIGVRVFTRVALERLAFNPASSGKQRAIDTSVLRNLMARSTVHPLYLDVHPLQIVDFKSAVQLNTYEACRPYVTSVSDSPFTDLAEVYPTGLVDQMAAVYSGLAVSA